MFEQAHKGRKTKENDENASSKDKGHFLNFRKTIKNTIKGNSKILSSRIYVTDIINNQPILKLFKY